MPFTRADMFYNDYRWNARSEGDDPRVTGEPDSTLLDRNEGYEVLYFVNRVAERNYSTSLNKATYQKIERIIRSSPTNIRSQAGIRDWILQNWNNY